jgi:hypothetical protein
MRRPTLKQLQAAVREADAKLDAATTLTAVNVAGKKPMRAKAELKEAEAEIAGADEGP